MLVFSQDTGAAGIATATKIFHRTSVTSGQIGPWFAAVLLFLFADLELEAHKEHGSCSPLLCHIRHRGVWCFYKRAMFQLKTRFCFLAAAPPGGGQFDCLCPWWTETFLSFPSPVCSLTFWHQHWLSFQKLFCSWLLTQGFYRDQSSFLPPFPPQAPQDWLFNLLS